MTSRQTEYGNTGRLIKVLVCNSEEIKNLKCKVKKKEKKEIGKRQN